MIVLRTLAPNEKGEAPRGFDCNQHVTRAIADAAVAKGYQFCVRYVRRATAHDYDLNKTEVADILASGLGLMLVQHYSGEGWRPSAALGSQYGYVAALEAAALVPRGTMIWCDLEGVARGVPADVIVAYLKNWYNAVAAAGFVPGLYVGYGCGLTNEELYLRLPFTHYWRAYNGDNAPIVRGFQMLQHVASAEDRIPGLDVEFDVDTIHVDHKGGTPIVLLDLPRGTMTPQQRSAQQVLADAQTPPTDPNDAQAWAQKLAAAAQLIQQLLPLVSFAWSIFGHRAMGTAPGHGQGGKTDEFKERAAEAGITLN
jgi:hypothetical protein